MGSFRLWLAVIIMALSLARAASAETSKEAVGDLVQLFESWSDSRLDTIQEKAARKIDYESISEMAFGEEQWRSFTPAQRSDLRQSLRQLLQTRYYSRWHRLFSRSTINIAGEVKRGNDSYVKSFIHDGKVEDVVIWHLHSHKGQPMVVDLNVNGKDLVKRLSERLHKQLKKRGPEALVAWLHREAYYLPVDRYKHYSDSQ